MANQLILADKRDSFGYTQGCNVCLKVDDGTTFWTRKEILQKRSPFFKAMFSSSWRESSTSSEGKPIEIHEVPSDNLRTLLHFMCNHEVVWPARNEREFFEQYVTLLPYAHYFGFGDELECSAAALLKPLLSSTSVFKLWKMSEAFSAQTLSEMCESFLTNHFGEASQTNEFLLSDRELLRRVLHKGEVDCEVDCVMQSLEIWAKFHLRLKNEPVTPSGVQSYIMDLLPPQTMFTKGLKEHILTFNPRLFY